VVCLVAVYGAVRCGVVGAETKEQTSVQTFFELGAYPYPACSHRSSTLNDIPRTNTMNTSM